MESPYVDCYKGRSFGLKVYRVPRGSERPSAAAELCWDYASSCAARAPLELIKELFQGPKQCRTSLYDASPDDDGFRIENVDERGDRGSQCL